MIYYILGYYMLAFLVLAFLVALPFAIIWCSRIFSKGVIKMAFDLSKPFQTRDGRKARIICTDKKGDYPIVALVESNGSEDVLSYTKKGFYYGDNESYNSCPLDLVNICVKHPHAELIIAWANGATIEAFIPDLKKWGVVPNPSWREDYKYRIKE